MTTTRLQISNPTLFEGVHHVYSRLPQSARAALDRANLDCITDRPTDWPPLTLAKCVVWQDGRQEILLNPALANQSAAQICFVVAHEFAHAIHGPTAMKYDAAEQYADALAEAWGLLAFRPAAGDPLALTL